MRILYLAPSIPYPPHTGGQIRSWYFLRHLASKGRVTLVSIGRPRDVNPHLGELKKYCAQVFLADPAKFVSNREMSGPAAVLNRLKTFCRLQPWLLDDFVDQEIKRQILLARPERHDLIVVRFGVMAYHFLTARELKKYAPKMVVDVDDVTTIMLKRKLETMERGYKKMRSLVDFFFLSLYYRKLKAALACFSVSEKDKQHMQENKMSNRIFVIPNVFELNGRKAAVSDDSKPEILFCGTMSYPPNQDAILFFCGKIFPSIRSVLHDAHLTIVGKNMPDGIKKLALEPGVTVAGSVPSMDPYYEQVACVVIPLLNGAGSRIKILEAMAYQRPVVSTRIGAEGLDVTDGENILLADTPGDFAQKCIELLKNSAERKRLVSNAYEFVKQNYDLPVLGQKLDGAITELMGDKE